MKICKNGNFRHISGIFGQNRIFLKNGLGHVLSIANTHLYGKNQKNVMMKSRENAKKPVFPAHFWHFRPEMNFFWKQGSVTFFGHCHFGSLCQKSAKTNEPISRKASNERTDRRTDERTKVNLQDLQGRSKKCVMTRF